MKKQPPITSNLTVTDQKLIWLYTDSEGRIEEFDTFEEGIDFLKSAYKDTFESVEATVTLNPLGYISMYVDTEDLSVHMQPVKKVNGYQTLSDQEYKYGPRLYTPIGYECTYEGGSVVIGAAVFSPS